MPTISVIVPIYKVEIYLCQCVESILNQTFRDFELILVDDGSPDGSPEICDKYAEMDSRVRVIHKQNGGLSSARNTGLDCAKGEFIAFVDSDDWVHPEYLECLYDAVQKENTDMAICGVEKFWDENPRVEQFPLIAGRVSREKAISLMTMVAWIIACNKLYRRKLWDNLRFPEGYIHEDEAVIHRVIGRCDTIMAITEQLYFYRQTNNSIMRSEFNIRRTDYLSALADRIVFSDQMKWSEVLNLSADKYAQLFFDYYFYFPRTTENEKYFQRMDASLKTALPCILKSKCVSVRHKIYLTSIRINPKIYLTLRRLLKK